MGIVEKLDAITAFEDQIEAEQLRALKGDRGRRPHLVDSYPDEMSAEALASAQEALA